MYQAWPGTWSCKIVLVNVLPEKCPAFVDFQQLAAIFPVSFSLPARKARFCTDMAQVDFKIGGSDLGRIGTSRQSFIDKNGNHRHHQI